MKKIYSLLLALVGLSLWPSMAMASDWQVIVDEHFDALTEGTEDAPSTVSLLDAGGYVMDVSNWYRFPDEYTTGWGGAEMYSAGGALAIRNGWFVNTPAGDHSGDLLVKCRMRLVKGQNITSDAIVSITLQCRHKFVTHKQIMVRLSEEWQEFTLTADNGDFEDDNIQIMGQGNFDYLVDDIYIAHREQSIPTPQVEYPTNVTNTGFNANWYPSADAESYLLSVYQKHDNPEFFESNDKGSVKGTEEFRSTYSPNTLTECVLSLSVDNNGMPIEEESKARLNITALTEDGWRPWISVSVDAARLNPEASAAMNLTRYLVTYSEIHQLAFSIEDADQCIVNIDNVYQRADGAPIIDYLLKDLTVPCPTQQQLEENWGLVTYRVEGRRFNPDADYYYSVRAHSERFDSNQSDEEFVFHVATPLTLPATDVTDEGFTANWECGKKADGFRVDCLTRYVAEEDQDNYLIIDEDFDKVKSLGTVEDPEQGNYTSAYESIDEFTKVGGWTATSWQMADGMLGGMGQEVGYIAGAISTPSLDLSHNNGICTIQIRAFGVPGDGIAIQGSSDFNTFNVAQFDEKGEVETEVALPMCGSTEVITFYSFTYSPFLIDYIRILQPLKKGDVVQTITKSVVVDDREIRSCSVTDINYNRSESLYYRVVAHRQDPTETTGFNYYTQNPNTVLVRSTEGIDTVLSPDAHVVPTYDLQGRPARQERQLITITAKGHKHLR